MSPEEIPSDPHRLASAVRDLVQAGDVAAALELVGRGWRAWTSSGELALGASAAAAALNAPGASTVRTWRARALYGDGVLAFRALENERSRSRNEEALAVARGEGDVRGECDALTGLARLELRNGRYAEVVSLAREARALARRADDLEAEASPLHLEAAGVRLQQKYEAARDLYEASLDLNRRLGNHVLVGMEQHNLGWVELHLGNLEAAEDRFRERDRATASGVFDGVWSELNWAAVAARRGRMEEARRRFDEVVRKLQALHMSLDPDDQAEFDWLEGLLAAGEC